MRRDRIADWILTGKGDLAFEVLFGLPSSARNEDLTRDDVSKAIRLSAVVGTKIPLRAIEICLDAELDLSDTKHRDAVEAIVLRDCYPVASEEECFRVTPKSSLSDHLRASIRRFQTTPDLTDADACYSLIRSDHHDLSWLMHFPAAAVVARVGKARCRPGCLLERTLVEEVTSEFTASLHRNGRPLYPDAHGWPQFWASNGRRPQETSHETGVRST
jgi:hypothetical protein